MAYNQELADYVKEQLNSGYSLEQIKDILIRKGWREAEVNEVINFVQGGEVRETPPPPPKETPPKNGLNKKVVAVLVIFLLICLVVIPLLVIFFFNLGMFNPQTFTLPIATGFSVFGKPATGDWEYSETEFSIKLPSQTYDVEIAEATVDIKGVGSCNPITDLEISTGRNIELDFTGCETSTSGSSYTAEITIKYTKSDTPFERTQVGTVTGVVS